METPQKLLIESFKKNSSRNAIYVQNKYHSYKSLHNLANKFKSFNWSVINVKNGHSFSNLKTAFLKLKNQKKPSVIILNTTKGKGIKEFEDNPLWHARKLEGNEINIGKKRLFLK